MERKVAYFSMEIGLDAGMPTYSGGLGILAGDSLRAAADLRVPIVGVTLLHRKGYFHQQLSDAGLQNEFPAHWAVEDFLIEEAPRVCVAIEEREVWIRAWRYDIVGASSYVAPVYFLDADLIENNSQDRALTDTLYGGDAVYRLAQEILLGIGGVRMLRALGMHQLERFHMNEGHSALLTMELLAERSRISSSGHLSDEDIEAVRQQCIFTTHTPVPAGHDRYPLELFKRMLGRCTTFLGERDLFSLDLARRTLARQHAAFEQFMHGPDTINMTYLALNLSHYINGVAKQHGQIARHLFGEYTIDSITNGVHAATWTAPPFQALFDRHITGWKSDNFSLRYSLAIPGSEIWEAHREAKKTLIRYVNRETNSGMDNETLTLGFARRATAYKRADLLFTDLQRLKEIAATNGPVQAVFAGKAHPLDSAGKELIQRIFAAKESLKKDIRIAYLENYDMDLAKLIIAGVDVWLNTPEKPMEASGTSGMKAALNGVPSLSVLDGWWVEGNIEGVTGWSIVPTGNGAKQQADSNALYEKLAHTVIPLFYKDKARFIDVMRHAIALNGSFFNTHRMIQQYVLNAYFL